MQSIVYLKLEAFYEKSYSSQCIEEFKRGVNDLVMVQVVSHRPVATEARVSLRPYRVWFMSDEVTVGQLFTKYFVFLSKYIILRMTHTLLSSS
jgi:hypothetical protein